MYRYDVDALDKIASALNGVKPHQMDMAYWRKTKPGESFASTVACAGGWVCLMKTFEQQGLQLVASNLAVYEWGYVPAIKGQRGNVLRGYAAMGYILQETKDNLTAEEYGRSIFSMYGKSPLDQRFKLHEVPESNPKLLVTKRIGVAKALMEPEIIKLAAAY